MIDRRTFVSLMAAGTLLRPGLSGARDPLAGTRLTGERKILVVYLSRTNNTKAIAEFIQQSVGGTMVALELQRPYPADYRATVQQVVHENETGYLPPLRTKIGRIEEYDVVFLGFPTWGMGLPPPVRSLLRQHNLAGKTVIPFNTNAGYGAGSSFEAVRALCPESEILQGFVTRGGVERDGQYLVIKATRAEEARREVRRWLRTIESRNTNGTLR